MLVAFSSPFKFSKSIFPVWNFVRSLKFYCKNNFCQLLWITQNQTVADSEEIREVYSTEILSNTATIGEVNLTKIDLFFA